MRVLAVALVLLLLPGGAGRAGAGESESERARQIFETGVKQYNLRNFDQALQQFKAAYDAVPDPALLSMLKLKSPVSL
jgi:outer membrane protein assembly factor BamD (BamD/ComL family)